MDLNMSDTYQRPEAQSIEEYRVERPIRAVSRHIENRVGSLQRSGSRITTVHPDTGGLAESQEYAEEGASIDLMQRKDPENSGYITEVHITGNRERVEALESTLNSIMEEL